MTYSTGLAFVVLLGMMLYFGIVPTWNVLWLPLLLLLALWNRLLVRGLSWNMTYSTGLALVTSLGVGLWLTALVLSLSK